MGVPLLGLPQIAPLELNYHFVTLPAELKYLGSTPQDARMQSRHHQDDLTFLGERESQPNPSVATVEGCGVDPTNRK